MFSELCINESIIPVVIPANIPSPNLCFAVVLARFAKYVLNSFKDLSLICKLVFLF